MPDPNWSYEAVPLAAQRLYRLCWQLETWLRTIVYVELRAARVDWEAAIQTCVRSWPPQAVANDKLLHHMTTPHQSALSYLTFGQLWSVVAHEDNWPFFQPYFPPKNITDARIEEVKAIRNRVAHFREPHQRDVDRLSLFMDDLEPGVRKFCHRYTAGMILRDPAQDQVSIALRQDWEDRGYGIELDGLDGWLYAPEPHRRDPLMNAGLAMLIHERQTPGSTESLIYALSFRSWNGAIDIENFFEATRGLHSEIVHIILSSLFNRVIITIPAVLGAPQVADLIFAFLSSGLGSLSSRRDLSIDRDRLRWPEYVLWPDHLLAFYDDTIQLPVLDTR